MNLLLFLPLVRKVRQGAEELGAEYTESSFDWSSIFVFIKWVVVVAAAIAVLVFAVVGVMVLVEMYKAERHWLRSVRHKAYRGAVRGTVREMVDDEIDKVRDEIHSIIRREFELERNRQATVTMVKKPEQSGKNITS